MLLSCKKTVRAVKGFEFESGVVLWGNEDLRFRARSGMISKSKGQKGVNVRAMRGGKMERMGRSRCVFDWWKTSRVVQSG